MALFLILQILDFRYPSYAIGLIIGISVIHSFVAAGMAEYTPETDSLISEIFDRADKEMYKNKRNIKKEKNQLG